MIRRLQHGLRHRNLTSTTPPMSSPFTETDAFATLDEALLTRIAKGDREAFEQLYERSSSMLFTLAMRMLGSRDEAADTVQDVLLDIWRKAARYDVSRGTPSAWLIAQTRQRAIDRLRAKRDRAAGKPQPDKPLAPILELSTPATAEAPDDAARRQRVMFAFGTLSPDTRQALEWTFFEGLSTAEIATRTREPLDTITARIRDGMERLLVHLRTPEDATPRYGT